MPSLLGQLKSEMNVTAGRASAYTLDTLLTKAPAEGEAMAVIQNNKKFRLYHSLFPNEPRL